MDTKLQFHRSSRCSEGGGCVEVARTSTAAYVRDGKRSDSPVLMYSADAWTRFVAGVKAGEFDV